MPNSFPFEVSAKSIRFDATNTAAAGDLGADAEQVAIWNTGTVGVFIRFDKNSGGAAAVAPTVGTPQDGMVIKPDGWVSLSIRGKRYFSAITLSSTATLYLTPGTGG
jgi:hypothetical protein